MKSSDERWFFESSSPLARTSGGRLPITPPTLSLSCGRRRPRRQAGRARVLPDRLHLRRPVLAAHLRGAQDGLTGACWTPARSWTPWPSWACPCWCGASCTTAPPCSAAGAAGPGSQNHLPNYGEFYEKRQFTPGTTEVESVSLRAGGAWHHLLFRCRQMPSFVLGVEICEDLWSALPPPPSTRWQGPPSSPTFGQR